MSARPAGSVLVALLLALGGCGGTPESRYYLLEPAAGPAGAYSAPGRIDRLVHVDRVQVPRYADRPELVTRSDARRMSFAAFEVWAEPLQEVVTRALVDGIGAELGYGDVLVTPGRRDVAPAARVTVEVLQLDGDPSGAMTLDARWSLLAGPDERLVATGRERIIEPAGEAAGTDQRVAALERAVAELARRLADAIRSQGGGG